MTPSGQHIQLVWIEQILKNEMWYLGEARGQKVEETDPELQIRVSNIIISGAGAYFRKKLDQENLNPQKPENPLDKRGESDNMQLWKLY